MNGVLTCPQCGAALPDQGWEGLCPKCLVRVSLEASVESNARPEPLRRFGNYELQEEIARGGMGVVYKARQVLLNRTVALKMILAGQLASTADVQRFQGEAESAARLQHANIVAIHEIGWYDGQHYFSMDYVEGQNLAEFVGQKPLSPKQAAKYLRIVAEAIHYAHQQGILHRDLKPSNILIDQSGQPRVTDFGLAKQMKGDSELTVSGQVLGSPNFMPPEQAAGKRTGIGPAADVYALGAILYFMVTGRPPFVAESLTETLRQVATVEPPAPHFLNPSVPRDLETICLKCLAKESQRRFESAKELADELERFIEDKPILARPSNRIEKSWRWCRRNPVIATFAGATVVLVLAVAIGSPIAAFRINQARLQAQTKEKEATDRLWDSYLAQARANRYSGRAGRRFDSLEALKKAAAIRPSPELRKEAIACLALTDLSVLNDWHVDYPGEHLAFSPLFDKYVVLNHENPVRLLSFNSQAELARAPSELAPLVDGARFSHDGRYLAVGSQPSGDIPNVLQVWDTVENRILFQLHTNQPISIIEFSPDSRRIAVGYSGSSAAPTTLIEIFDLNSGAPLQSVVMPRPPWGASFDPSSTKLAVFYHVRSPVVIYDLNNPQAVPSLTHPDIVRALAWHPDGSLLATGCGDKLVYVWDTVTCKLRNVLHGHQSDVTSLQFNHRGNLLVTGSWDGTSRLWEPLGEDLPVSLTVGSCGFSTDDRRLLCELPNGRCAFAAVADGAECRVLHSDTEPRKGPRGCDFSPDGLWLASAHTDGVRIWETVTGKLVARLPLGNTLSVLFHPNGLSLFTSGADGVKQWPVDWQQAGSGRRLRFGPPRTVCAEQCERASLDHEGRLLSFVCGNRIRIVDLESGKDRIHTSERAQYVALSPGGQWLADGGFSVSEGVKVRDLHTGQVTHEFPEAPYGSAVSFSPDGKWLAACTQTECRFWAVGSWNCVHATPRGGGAAQARVAFSHDGSMVAIPLVARGVLLLTPGSWKELADLEPPSPQYISDLNFSPDDGYLAAAAETKQIHVWDLRSIRQQLAAMNLDWDAPPLLPPATDQFQGPIAVTILEATNASNSLKPK